MLKGKLAACCLVALGLLVASGTAFAGVIDPCNSTAAIVFGSQAGPTVTASVCPSGDGEDFGVQGFYISFQIEDGLGNGIPNVPASDFWLDDCDAINDLIVLCGGASSSSADSLTNSLGRTTMSQTGIAAGDCALGVICIVQGEILEDNTCTAPRCLSVYVKSFDLTGDLNITLSDLSLFAQGYPPQAFSNCTDYSGNGTNNLPDLSLFSQHFGPPGHICP
jgi:hypothetical protein